MTNDEKFLEVKKKAQEIKEMYDSDPKQSSFNLLLTGETGSGKTNLAITCRKPVHIDSFDPGGTKHLRKEIASGQIIADTRWEGDDPYNPNRWIAWVKEMQHRMEIGYFDFLGTYFLDSSTTWADSIMSQILKKAGIPGEVPRFTHDYHPQKVQIVNWIKWMLRLPCDFILTGHLDASKDEVTGSITYRYMTTGKAEVTIPLLFDEIWVTDTKKTSKGVEYRLVTARTGPYLASTRIGKGVFEVYESPDIKKLLKKAGLPTEDKPLLTI
jgi:hypothetical protein